MSPLLMRGAAASIIFGAAAWALPACAEGIVRVPAGTGAPFSAATEFGGVLYLSGQIGAAPDGTLPEGFEAQARQAMDNIQAVLARRSLVMSDVFKCTVMLSDMQNFAAFNRIYTGYFQPGALPSRSAIGVAGLARGALVEVECMAEARPRH